MAVRDCIYCRCCSVWSFATVLMPSAAMVGEPHLSGSQFAVYSVSIALSSASQDVQLHSAQRR